MKKEKDEIKKLIRDWKKGVDIKREQIESKLIESRIRVQKASLIALGMCGITVDDVAKKSGVDSATIRRFICEPVREVESNTDEFIKMCDAFHEFVEEWKKGNK